MPIWMAISSDEAQYFPSRNSRTKTGTLAPVLTLRTRSLRTTLPANSRFALSSSASRAGALFIALYSPTSSPGLERPSATRKALWVQDLQRYGIQCVEVDQYEDVDEILHAVELRLAGGSIFVSGSLPPDAPDDQRQHIENISREIGRVVAEHEKRLVSGFGFTVGSAAVSGALGVILKEPTPNLEKSLLLRPFPQEAPPGTDVVAFRTRYRDGMIQQAGLCVFICGLKRAPHGGALVVADGVMEEYKMAKRLGRIIVPVGASGGAAAGIWELVEKSGILPAGLSKADFSRLNDAGESPAALAGIIAKAIEAVDKPARSPRGGGKARAR